MITAKQIRELIEAKPFKPFRVCMSDGTHYDRRPGFFHDVPLVRRFVTPPHG